MRCRHTVPDWHRHVVEGEGQGVIYAACRLLLREGERAADARTIACAYWGRQEACPLYEGPRATAGAPAAAAPAPAGRQARPDEPPWPVRGPGERDPGALALLGLQVAAMAALVVLVALALAGIGVGRFWLLLAAGLSLGTLLLSALRTWAGR